MEKIANPKREEWAALLARPRMEDKDLLHVCEEVFAEVRKNGDRALSKYTWHFDQVRLDRFLAEEAEYEEAEMAVGTELKAAIREAKRNIEAFHAMQRGGRNEYVHPQGFRCWQESRGIERVGLYVPGGTAPLFSTVLMLAVPAEIAGCGEVILCTPPDRTGKIHPAVLWTARLCGVRKVFKLGGIQAIGAMALGTETVPAVCKIFGPGNQYVTAAKQLAFHCGVAIDMPAGPSELMVLADRTADARFVAADLLSQVEHGPDSQAVLVTTEEELVDRVEREMEKQSADLPRREIVLLALRHSKAIVLKDLKSCLEMANAYAPEHLILCLENAEEAVPEIRNAGSVFLGRYSPESVGDYASGTNHTLPTNGFAKAYSGVNLDAFVKKITFQEVTREGLAYLAPTVSVMAGSEGLEAHRRAVEIRLHENDEY